MQRCWIGNVINFDLLVLSELKCFNINASMLMVNWKVTLVRVLAVVL